MVGALPENRARTDNAFHGGNQRFAPGTGVALGNTNQRRIFQGDKFCSGIVNSPRRSGGRIPKALHQENGGKVQESGQTAS